MEFSRRWMWEDKPADTGTAAVGLFAGPQSCKIAGAFYAFYGWGQNAGINASFFPRCWKVLYQILENIKLVEFALKQISILNLCSEMVSN